LKNLQQDLSTASPPGDLDKLQALLTNLRLSLVTTSSSLDSTQKKSALLLSQKSDLKRQIACTKQFLEVDGNSEYGKLMKDQPLGSEDKQKQLMLTAKARKVQR